MAETISPEQALLRLRADPTFATLVRDAYLGENRREAAEHFLASAEWAETRRLLAPWMSAEAQARGVTVLDLGAGSGIASYALAKSGASLIHALEPDPSDQLGAGAIRSLCQGLNVRVITEIGERLPLADACVDIVYARQVLHHIMDLPGAMAQCARVLRPGGVFLACREHVVDDDEQMRQFLAAHPVHQLTGGENAYRLDQYTAAIRSAGLRIDRVFETWDTVINAFPMVRSEEDRRHYPRTALGRRLGPLAGAVCALPGVEDFLWKKIRRPLPGRLYSFLAVKP